MFHLFLLFPLLAIMCPLLFRARFFFRKHVLCEEILAFFIFNSIFSCGDDKVSRVRGESRVACGEAMSARSRQPSWGLYSRGTQGEQEPFPLRVSQRARSEL